MAGRARTGGREGRLAWAGSRAAAGSRAGAGNRALAGCAAEPGTTQLTEPWLFYPLVPPSRRSSRFILSSPRILQPPGDLAADPGGIALPPPPPAGPPPTERCPCARPPGSAPAAPPGARRSGR